MKSLLRRIVRRTDSDDLAPNRSSVDARTDVSLVGATGLDADNSPLAAGRRTRRRSPARVRRLGSPPIDRSSQFPLIVYVGIRPGIVRRRSPGVCNLSRSSIAGSDSNATAENFRRSWCSSYAIRRSATEPGRGRRARPSSMPTVPVIRYYSDAPCPALEPEIDVLTDVARYYWTVSTHPIATRVCRRR